jgi:hypothetical protein
MPDPKLLRDVRQRRCPEINAAPAASGAAVAWARHTRLRLGRPMRYRDGMQIYIFASDSHSTVSAFTSDQTGGNLPTDYAPWRHVNGGKAMFVESVADPVAVAVLRGGYFLLGSKAWINDR